jgi:hypothetical protein
MGIYPVPFFLLRLEVDMRRVASRVTGSLFALFCAVSLTFGGTTVFAQAEQQICQTSPPTFLGACTSERQCDERCWGAGGIDGECVNGCCICYY